MKFTFVLLICFSLSPVLANDQLAIPLEHFDQLGEAIHLHERNQSGIDAYQYNLQPRAIVGDSAGFSIDTSHREQSRVAFNTLFSASNRVDSEWNGNISSCLAGTTAATYKQAVLTRVNYFRAMAGVPATISLNSEYNDKAQQAAMMMSAQNSLSHTPGTDWNCYTTSGAEAASKSNLSLGNAGYNAVFSQMRDNGSNNAPVGHRRWILYPNTQQMGTGDIPAHSTWNSANALWVVDNNALITRPVTREVFVSWPPPGYTPIQLAFDRWSFSWPQADFSAATVEMRRLDTNQMETVQLEHRATGFGIGDSTIVWQQSSSDLSSVTDDTSWEITIRNFDVNGQLMDQTYTVTLFDPGQPGQDTVLPEFSGDTQPSTGTKASYSFNQVPIATGFEYKLSSTQSVPVFDAETGLHNDLTAVTSQNYDIVQSHTIATGAASYQFAHTNPENQYLTINKPLFIRDNAQLIFDSQLGLATSDQSAQVQISIDNGSSWITVYNKSGGNRDTQFDQITVDLSSYNNRIVNFRFVYAFSSGTYYPQSQPGIGWFIDNIRIDNAYLLLENPSQQIPQWQNGVLPLTFNTSGLQILAARATAFGGYPLEWGPAVAIDVKQPKAVLDIDGSLDQPDALTDGLLLIRYLFGLSGNALTNNAVKSNCSQCTATTIQSELTVNRTRFDIDGSGAADALTDGLLIIRYLFGLRGNTLTDNAVSPRCSRCTSNDIESYLATLL